MAAITEAAKAVGHDAGGCVADAGLHVVPGEVDEALAAIDPDQLSPRDALAALYQLKSLQANNKS